MKDYDEIEGDGGSRVLEQVEARQGRIRERLRAVRHRVAIGSGKGGVGKSTLTYRLARALAKGGARVAVLDADLNGPSQARLAGLGAAPLVPGASGLSFPRSAAGVGVVSLGALVPETESVEFETVAPNESHTWRATREFSFLGQLLEAVEWGELDYLLIDLPPGAERTFQAAQFFGDGTSFCLVTLPSALSRGVVSRSLAALRRTENPILGYIENMAGYYCSDCGEVRPLFPEGEPVALDLDCLGRIPFDPRLAAGGPTDANEDESPGLDAIAKIAEAVTARLESER